MGSGIAEAVARAGYTVLIYDPLQKAIQNAENNIHLSLDKLVAKEKITESDKLAAINKISFTTNLEECRGDLIIEAIVEDLVIKQKLFAGLQALNGSHAILASNTSSLSLQAIAEPLEHRERICGLHFFNPAQVMKLVEVVETTWTSGETIENCNTFIESLEKVPVLCKDSPGFIVNRVARHYYLESLKLLEDGVTDLETIDRLLENAGFKMGPFKLMDLIGNDVNLAVSKLVYEALGQTERFKPSSLQEEKVLKGELGRKTGKGFYKY